MNQQQTAIWEDLNRTRYLISILAKDIADREYEASESLILIEKQLSAIADQLDREAFKMHNATKLHNFAQN